MKLEITCVKCQQSKPQTEFNKDSSRKSGYSPYCLSCRSINNNTYYPNYREAAKEKFKENYSNNKERYFKASEDYRKKPENSIRLQKAKSIKNALKKGTKSEILGCDGNQARIELEVKSGFSIDWPNFTRDFQLDYIKPLSSFNLTNPTEISQAFNIQNLILKKRKFSLDL